MHRKGLVYKCMVAILAVLVVLPAPLAHAASVNSHTVILDANGKIIPWTANPGDGYHTVVTSAWNYLLNSVPNDPSTGKPAYYSQSYLNPDTQTIAGWPHNPAGLYAMLTESALKYYAYSGDSAPVTLAQNVATWQLDHGMTASTDNWASVPYASGDAGSLTYDGAVYGNTSGAGDGKGVIEPDKIGQMGYAWLQLYDVTGNTRYRDAAIACANALASHVRSGNATQSPWPFRVIAQSGTIKEQYSANVIDPIRLFDGLIARNLGSASNYQAARTTAWTWLMAYPMQNNVWANYFEDVGIRSGTDNINQLNAMMTARYLLEHPEYDTNWETHVRGLIAWVETTFGADSYGATTIKEQNAFPYAMGSHTSRYASVNALLYAKTGDTAAKAKAYYALNWATYMARPNGVVIDGPQVNNQWFTDGYGDYIRHFLTAMQAVPEWAPANQTHLTGSTSLVSNITYSSSGIQYTTTSPASTENVRLNFTPSSVIAGGVALSQRADLSQEGWVYNVATSTLSIRHDAATTVQVISGAPSNIPPTVTLTTPTNGTTVQAGTAVSLGATASDSDGTVTKVDYFAGQTLLASSSTAPYAAAWTPSTAGTFAVTAVATDNSGATTTSSAASITVTTPTTLPTPWVAADVGSTGVAGSSGFASNVFTLKGSGVDIWDNADSFHFVYQPMEGDGSIVARVASQQNTDPWALAGIMIRDDLTPGSKHAVVATTPSNGLAFTWRSAANGGSSYTSGGTGAAPYWLKLTRSGSTFTASRSTNGTTWTQFTQATIAMDSSTYVGLAVTSHNNSVLGTATFDNVAVNVSGDTTAPTITNVASGVVNQNGGTISWNTNDPADSQVEYGITTAYGQMTARNTTFETAHAIVVSGLNAGTTYHYRVISRDAAGNTATSGDYVFTTQTVPDTTAPSVPTNLTASPTSTPSVSLSWAASTDNVAVTGYQIWRDGAQLATTASLAYTDTVVAANETHSYSVRAYDAAGNVSADSTSVSATLPPAVVNPISIDTSVTTSQTTNATSISSPSFATTGYNQLLVAFITSDGPNGTQSFSGVTGGGLTWTLRKRVNTQRGTSEIWTAASPLPLTNVVVKATRSSGSYQGMLHVVAFKNAAFGATGGNNATTGAANATVMSTAANAWVWGVGNDWDGATARTVGANQTKVQEMLAPASDTFWVQRQTAITPVAGTTVAINTTAPTNHRWNLALLEIVPQ